MISCRKDTQKKYTNITIARNMLYHVADAAGSGMNVTMDMAALKLFASEQGRLRFLPKQG